jgi:hypothetical protein
MRIASLVLLLLMLGCSSSEHPASSKVSVPLADVAPELRAIAEKELPNVKFDSARKIKVDGEDVYEIRGKQSNGKIREVEVSVSGKVIEVE